MTEREQAHLRALANHRSTWLWWAFAYVALGEGVLALAVWHANWWLLLPVFANAWLASFCALGYVRSRRKLSLYTGMVCLMDKVRASDQLSDSLRQHCLEQLEAAVEAANREEHWVEIVKRKDKQHET